MSSPTPPPVADAQSDAPSATPIDSTAHDETEPTTGANEFPQAELPSIVPSSDDAAVSDSPASTAAPADDSSDAAADTTSSSASPSGPIDPPVAPPPPLPGADNTDHPADVAEDAESDTDEPTPPSTLAVDTDSSAVPAVDTDKLAGMKQQALDHLEPLVASLDQNPQEEFKTTMMMIQANDNHTLLDKALSAAKSIEDDKERAQALLDIINEINYFSQGGQPATAVEPTDPETPSSE